MRALTIGCGLLAGMGVFMGAAWARDGAPGSAAATGQYLPPGLLRAIGGPPPASGMGAAPAAPAGTDAILRRMFVTGDGTSHLSSGAPRGAR